MVASSRSLGQSICLRRRGSREGPSPGSPRGRPPFLPPTRRCDTNLGRLSNPRHAVQQRRHRGTCPAGGRSLHSLHRPDALLELPQAVLDRWDPRIRDGSHTSGTPPRWPDTQSLESGHPSFARASRGSSTSTRLTTVRPWLERSTVKSRIRSSESGRPSSSTGL